jgi:hypothetical protein
VITWLAGLTAPQALWSAAARRRFYAASLLASCPLGYCLRAGGQRAAREESGSPPRRAALQSGLRPWHWAAVLPRRWRVALGVARLVGCMLGLADGLLTGYA